MIKKILIITALSTLVFILVVFSVSQDGEQLSSEKSQTYEEAHAEYMKLFNGKGQTVVYANGTTMHYEIINGKSKRIMGGENNGDWVVKESRGLLIASVNGQTINITNELKDKGYFYYGYRDDGNILHRLYIVRNAGGTKDYAERWYSQQEWLPELGIGGGSRGMSGPLGAAIVSADDEVDAGDEKANLDTALEKHLKQYWNEYGDNHKRKFSFAMIAKLF